MANKKFSKISKAARSLARLRWQEDPVMRLAARYGNRGRLQAVSRGKVVLNLCFLWKYGVRSTFPVFWCGPHGLR